MYLVVEAPETQLQGAKQPGSAALRCPLLHAEAQSGALSELLAAVLRGVLAAAPRAVPPVPVQACKHICESLICNDTIIKGRRSDSYLVDVLLLLLRAELCKLLQHQGLRQAWRCCCCKVLYRRCHRWYVLHRACQTRWR